MKKKGKAKKAKKAGAKKKFLKVAKALKVKAKKKGAKGKRSIKRTIARKVVVKATRKRGKKAGRKASVGTVLLTRAQVQVGDTWDLTSLFESDAAWEAGFNEWSGKVDGYGEFRGKLGESAEWVARCMAFDRDFERMGEKIWNYASLKSSEDTANSDSQRMVGRCRFVGTKAAAAASYVRPEIMAIDSGRMDWFLNDPVLAEWKLAVERMLRYRPHVLSDKEENLLAMQGEMSGAASQIFRQLNDADLKFGMIEDEEGKLIELGHSSFSSLLHAPSRPVREKAFHQYYAQYDGHKNAMAASLAGSVQRDVYYAKARNYPSALESSLFDDRAPLAVYDNLIAAVRKNLPALHGYYELRRRKMKLKDVHHYDTYVPILSNLEKRHSWDDAVKVVVDSLAPMGEEYCSVLHRGLTTARWCDRYPNQGKRSGAFSSGGYDGEPYILMNYQPDVLDHVFTLTHEAGHSMHSYYSAKNQPYQYYNYTIFVAEVASTFNEQLLAAHMMKTAKTAHERAFLINRVIDSIRGTIIRQTMFAEFEKVIHALSEAGEPLTVEKLRGEYRKLLEVYFGPEFAIDDVLSLECLRIPHFYNAFYVYKYATGLSAAIALSQRVLNGGAQELGDYLGFLKGGCSKFPLDLLRDAGVDMEKPEPVDTALAYFESLVKELDELL